FTKRTNACNRQTCLSHHITSENIFKTKNSAFRAAAASTPNGQQRAQYAHPYPGKDSTPPYLQDAACHCRAPNQQSTPQRSTAHPEPMVPTPLAQPKQAMRQYRSSNTRDPLQPT